jgi:hypothetical protein
MVLPDCFPAPVHLIASVFPNLALENARAALVAIAVATCMPIGPETASAQTLPPGSAVHGRTIREWTQDWWNWSFSFPVAIEPFGDEPLTDVTGEHAGDKQSGPVFFLNAVAGPTMFSPVTRTFEVPGGVHLLINLLAIVAVASPDMLCEDLAPLTESAVDGIDSLLLIIDGVPVPEADLFEHREPTGCFTALVPVEGSPSQVPRGAYPGSYGSGYWVMIPSLEPGPHVTRAGGRHLGFGIQVDVTKNINVSPVPALSLSGLCLTGSILLITSWVAFRNRGV